VEVSDTPFRKGVAIVLRFGGSMERPEPQPFDAKAFLALFGDGRATQSLRKGHVIFAQGDPADSVFYIQRGKIKLATVSPRGKEAVIAILSEGLFFGEGCLADQPARMVSAVAITDCSIVQVKKAAMNRILHDERDFSGMFITHLLTRNIRIEEDLIDHLFNSSEKRLARVLLLLANFGKDVQPQEVIPNISQETLAEMIGTTRSRVSFFLNKFRKLGFIEYNGEMHVHSSLLNVILHD
jgi:CRP-like cAMP-binding protein